MALVTFIVMWCMPEHFIPAMPLIVLYFAIITGIEHCFIVKSAYKEPRIFIRNFLGATVGVILIHLVVILSYAFTHMEQAKLFLLTFLIGFAIYLAFETAELIHFVKSNKSTK